MRRHLTVLLTTSLASSLTLSLAAALTLLASGPAQAASTSRSDPNDTTSHLDVRRVTLATHGRKLAATVRTWDAFTTDDLTGLASIGVDFKVSATKVRGVGVSASGSDLVARICTYRTGSSATACSKVPVTRVDDTTLRVTIPRAKIAKGARTYRWRGSSITQNSFAGCTESPVCLDTMVSGSDRWFRFKA